MKKREAEKEGTSWNEGDESENRLRVRGVDRSTASDHTRQIKLASIPGRAVDPLTDPAQVPRCANFAVRPCQGPGRAWLMFRAAGCVLGSPLCAPRAL